VALILGVARRLVLLVLLFRSRAHVAREVREVEVRVGAVWNKPGKGSKDSLANKEKASIKHKQEKIIIIYVRNSDDS